MLTQLTNDFGTQYRGRFAPSPSGPLHFGSLIAAVASYCQAKANQGIWLVRMEDIDPPREQIGADTLIMQCLEAHGLYWDEHVMYQSQRTEIYENVLQALKMEQKLFYCSCTRKALRQQLEQSDNPNNHTTLYSGTCRDFTEERENCSIRLRIDDQIIMFHDAIQGLYSQELETDVGDFVLKRRDGLYAYQLAVVVDDIAQGITEVVRGVDLLDSTPRQLYLYQCLNSKAPDYVHLPLALQTDGKKLSKQTGATALDNQRAPDNLVNVLRFLGQEPDPKLLMTTVNDILEWAVENWSLDKINK